MKYTEEQLSIIKAAEFNEEGYATNVEVAYKDGGNWEHTIHPTWQFTKCDYRIKQKPRSRPYKEAKKEWRGKGVILKEHKLFDTIISVSPFTNDFLCVKLGSRYWTSLQDLFDYYTWEDGSPCGALIEEEVCV